MQSENELDEIRNRIRDGVYSLRENETKNASGAHWNTIRVVFDEEGNRLPNVFACSMNFCNEVFRTNLSKDGTGKLKRHYARCNHSERLGINSVYDKEYQPPLVKKFKSHHKTSVNEAAVSFVVDDMRPVESVTKSGMVKLLSAFTHVGANYGPLDTSDILRLLSSRFSVSWRSSLQKYCV